MNKTTRLPLFGLIFICLALTAVAAPYIDYDDYYTYHGDNDDAKVWINGNITTDVVNPPSSTDAICWDWNDNGGYSNCWFNNGVSETECDDNFNLKDEYGNTVDPSDLSAGNCDLFTERLCEHQLYPIDKKEAFNNRAALLKNCVSGSPSFEIIKKKHYVMDQKFNDCDDNVGHTTTYDIEGIVSASTSTDLVTSLNCTANKECDENHDDAYISDPFGSIPNPCRTKNGYSCSVDQNCVSDLCHAGICRDSTKPFFDILTISPNDPTPTAGDTLKFTITVKNLGASGSSDVRAAAIFPNGTYCPTEFKGVSINKDATKSVTVNWTIPVTGPEGEYDINASSWDDCWNPPGNEGICWPSNNCEKPQDSKKDPDDFTVSLGKPNISVTPTSLVFKIG